MRAGIELENVNLKFTVKLTQVMDRAIPRNGCQIKGKKMKSKFSVRKSDLAVTVETMEIIEVV